MRRMITNKQVVEIVNKAIDDGEIEVGGADNALVLPEVAPTSQQLVGINTSGEQNSLTIGEGLEIANGELVAPAEIVQLNFNGSDNLDISDELYNKLFTAGSENVIIYAYKVNLNNANSSFYTHEKASSQYYMQATQHANSGIATSVGGLKVSQVNKHKIAVSGSAGSRKLTVSEVSDKFIDRITQNYDIETSFDNNSGTKTGYINKFYSSSLAYINLYYLPDGKNTTRYVPLHVLEYVYNQTILAEGRDATNKYTLNWNLSTGAYTITTTTI